MIEGLNRLLEGSGQPCLAELRELLENVQLGRDRVWRLIDQEPLQTQNRRVFRLKLACGREVRSLVVKRLQPAMALRNELVAQRWLPMIGLEGCCPLLLGTAAARDGSCIWHLSEDLGPWTLNLELPDRPRVEAAIALLARLHTRFADHALLGEVRLHGSDFGIHFYQTNVQDALRALEGVRPPADRHALCDRLRDRLRQMREELPARAEALAELGGPETLLHGDLWAINVFVSHSQGGLKARLIDWDRTGVGPISYDFSTFLLRFPDRHRLWALGLYRKEVAREGWQLPGNQELNLLFETAELARYANCVIWPAIRLGHEHTDWAFDQLADVAEWFENLSPVLPNLDGELAANDLSR